ncbi:MAG: inorganic diphosphatase [Caulobacteraceae bacterium]
MGDLSRLSHGLDREALTCQAVIESPRGSRTKFDYDPAIRAFRVKTHLPEGLSIPLDFGFVPSTLAEDGDPLDIMVLSEEPLPMGSVLIARLVGVIEAEETEKGDRHRNDRVLAAAAVSRLYAKVKAVEDLPSDFTDNLVSFWTAQAKLEGKTFEVIGVREAARAAELVKKTAKAAKTRTKTS